MKRKDNQKWKTKFRASKKWKDFRDRMREKQKVDPVTGAKLTRCANLHHKVLTDEESVYTDISDEDNFVFVNQMTHKVIHFLFSKSKPGEWRSRIARLVEILEDMEEKNGKEGR